MPAGAHSGGQISAGSQPGAREEAQSFDLRVEFGQPEVDRARLSLYDRYHASQANRKGWQAEEIDADDYRLRFLHSTIPAVEVSIWDGDLLCAVALTELTPNTVSGIYHYHDPQRLDRSLGTFVILNVIELARQRGKPYAYFGYYAPPARAVLQSPLSPLRDTRRRRTVAGGLGIRRD